MFIITLVDFYKIWRTVYYQYAQFCLTKAYWCS